MSYSAFLDDAAASARRPRGVATRLSMQVHRNQPRKLDALLDDAERIINALTSEIGAEKSSQVLERLANIEAAKRRICSRVKGHGAQPSVEDLTLSDEDDVQDLRCGRLIPYGFWNRYIREDLNLIPSRRKK